MNLKKNFVANGVNDTASAHKCIYRQFTYKCVCVFFFIDIRLPGPHELVLVISYLVSSVLDNAITKDFKAV
jgi:hypothetical protein